MGLPAIALAASAIGAGASVYSTHQQSKSAEQAAKFNAEQARKAGKVKSEDARQNALRRQEEHRKYLASLRARMLEKSPTIEGGDLNFLNEATGNLELRLLDNATAVNREQANIANQAFRMDWQADQISSTRMLNTGAAAIAGFNSVYRTGKDAGYWGQPKSNANIGQNRQNYPNALD